MGLILQDLYIYTPYILRTSGKKRENKWRKEKWVEETQNLKQAV